MRPGWRGSGTTQSGALTAASTPIDSDVARADRLLRMFGEADHPSLGVVLRDFRIDELAPP